MYSPPSSCYYNHLLEVSSLYLVRSFLGNNIAISEGHKTYITLPLISNFFFLVRPYQLESKLIILVLTLTHPNWLSKPKHPQSATGHSGWIIVRMLISVFSMCLNNLDKLASSRRSLDTLINSLPYLPTFLFQVLSSNYHGYTQDFCDYKIYRIFFSFAHQTRI